MWPETNGTIERPSEADSGECASRCTSRGNSRPLGKITVFLTLEFHFAISSISFLCLHFCVPQSEVKYVTCVERARL
jgi:hypothetical protein